MKHLGDNEVAHFLEHLAVSQVADGIKFVNIGGSTRTSNKCFMVFLTFLRADYGAVMKNVEELIYGKLNSDAIQNMRLSMEMHGKKY